MLSLRPSFVIFRSSPNTRYISTSYLFRAYHVILVPALFRLLPSSGNHRSGNERNQTSNSLTLLAGAGKPHLLPTNIQSSSSSERQTEFDRTQTKKPKLDQTTTIPPHTSTCHLQGYLLVQTRGHVHSVTPPQPTMASQLTETLGKLGMFLQPQTPTHDYEGLEYRWKSLVFRPALFHREAIMAGFMGLLLLTYLLGKKWNEQKARAW